MQGRGFVATLLSIPGNCDSFGRGRDAVGQIYVPSAFAVVHAQDHACIARRVIDGRLQEQKIGPHLGNGERTSVDQQTHFNQSGVTALI